MIETFYDVMRRQGISRRSFVKFCSLTASALGLGPAVVPQIVHAMETKPRLPVLWLHGLECTCCSESFIPLSPPTGERRHPVHDLGLDYDDTIMAAAGHQAEAIIDETIEKYDGNYILAVEGNPPLNQEGMSCIIGGKPFFRTIAARSQAQQSDYFLGQLCLLGMRASCTPQSNPGRAHS